MAMPLVTVTAEDPRAQPLAYVTNGRDLYEIVDDRRGVLILENCQTGNRTTIGRAQISAYRLVRPAPQPPDHPPAEPTYSD